VDDAARRREARKNWRTHVFRSWEDAEDFDMRFWAAIPVDERARVAWELTEELYAIAHPEEPHVPRLRRSVAIVTRR
jgi:hypothetical protein